MPEDTFVPVEVTKSTDAYITIEKVGSVVHKSYDRIPSPESLKSMTDEEGTDKSNILLLLKSSSLIYPTKNGGTVINEEDCLDITSESLDTIQSGESLIKYYCFDSSKYNNDTDKCIAFWKAIMEDANLKLVLEEYYSESTSQEEEVEEREEVVKVTSYSEEPEEYVWYNVLLEMHKRKMDELALAAFGGRCKMCNDFNIKLPEFLTNKSTEYTKEELQEKEDILCLNQWDPTHTKESSLQQTSVAIPEEVKVQERKDSSEPKNIDNQEALEVCHECTCAKVKCHCVLTRKKITKQGVAVIDDPIYRTEESDNYKELNKAESAKNLYPSINQKLATTTSHAHKVLTTPQIVARNVTVPLKKQASDASNCKRSEYFYCQKEVCTCKQYFEKEATEFVKEVRYELSRVRKDKACDTADYEQPKPVPPRQPSCSVCNDRTLCDVMHEKVGITRIPPQDEDIYLEPLFESTSYGKPLSTTMLPKRKSRIRSIAFAASKTIQTLKETQVIPDIEKNKSVQAKPFKAKTTASAPPLLSEIPHEESSDSIEANETPTTNNGPLLWYSSDILDNH